MSKVMQALEHSERRHKAFDSTQQYGQQVSSQPLRATNKLACMLAIALPPLLVAGGVVYQTYDNYKSHWLTNNVVQTTVVNVPSEFTVAAAPVFSELKSTYKAPVILSDLEYEYNGKPTRSEVSHDASTNLDEIPSDDLLKGLDLSELSPELAQRFESALSSQPSKANKRTSDVSNLAHDAQQWYGKLPALNFQTHVYSSKESKRWVKINGSEFGQGDWINDDLQLVAIEQQSCLVRFKGEEIEIPALYDWQG
ncbi:general secretion pathway protein GspB [Vibrio hepatarius]|uniref:general secretion pathway protein GspB n=1 Tax=Vibrio hepatarius TaxID=171383 RepID=UPI0037367A35